MCDPSLHLKLVKVRHRSFDSSAKYFTAKRGSNTREKMICFKVWAKISWTVGFVWLLILEFITPKVREKLVKIRQEMKRRNDMMRQSSDMRRDVTFQKYRATKGLSYFSTQSLKQILSPCLSTLTSNCRDSHIFPVNPYDINSELWKLRDVYRWFYNKYMVIKS